MYLTTRFLCFYSSLFGLEKKIRIPMMHIKEVRKEVTAMVIPNAISVMTPRKEYIFRSFWDRDAAYDILIDLIAKQKEGTTESATKSTSDGSDSNRTRSATEGTEIDHDGGEEHGEEDDDEPEEQLQREMRTCAGKRKVITFTLDTTLDTFEKMFISNGAPESMATYHKNHGDENVEDEEWVETSKKFGYHKVIHFLKVVNLPGLRATRGKKVQRLKRFGDAGLIVCSSTLLEDVPCADCFSVDDLCAVVVKDGKLEIEISFEVKFIKSTMLKYMIESNTNTEMTKWLNKFATNMTDKAQEGNKLVAGDVKLTAAADKANEEQVDVASVSTASSGKMDNILIIIVSVQLFMILLLVIAVFMLNSSLNQLRVDLLNKSCRA